jgi:cell division septation protein DedD
MAKKPRIPSEPVEPIEPVQPVQPEQAPEFEGEKLPWLQRVEDDEPRGSGAGGRLAGYLVGAAILIIAVVAIAWGVASRRQAPSTNDIDENLAGLAPEETQSANSLQPAIPVSVPPRGPRHGAEPRHQAAIGDHGTHGRARIDREAHDGKGATRHEAGGKAPHEPKRKQIEPTRSAASVGHHETARTSRHDERKSAKGATHHRAPRTTLSGPSDLLQLGAYDSRAAAERIWARLSHQHGYADRAHNVERARVHGHIYYRLRVRMPARARPCLHNRGVPCMVVSRGR